MTGYDELNLKFTLILALTVCMSSLNFLLSRVEHEKSLKKFMLATQFIMKF